MKSCLLQVRVPEELRDALQERANELETTLSEVVRQDLGRRTAEICAHCKGSGIEPRGKR
jgi:hypothetical protein